MSDSVDPAVGSGSVDESGRQGFTTNATASAIGVVGIAIGFWVTRRHVRHRAEIDDLYDEGVATADLDVWLVLLGSIGAVALAIGLLSIVWLFDLIEASKALTPKTIAMWMVAVVSVVSALIVTVIAASGESETATLNGSVADATRALTIGVACCSLPGLVYFGALRVAAHDQQWLGGESTRIRNLFLLRRLLFRQISLFGALLTLIVIATGIRRRTLLKIDVARAEVGLGEQLDIPIEQVLLYGLTFAALLGLFYSLASSALARLSRTIVDTYAPIPDSSDDELGAKLGVRTQVDAFISGSGARQTFETSVVILSPLVTALIGAAIS